MSAIRIQWQAPGDLSPERGSDFVSKKVPRSGKNDAVSLSRTSRHVRQPPAALLGVWGLVQGHGTGGGEGQRPCLSVCLSDSRPLSTSGLLGDLTSLTDQ